MNIIFERLKDEIDVVPSTKSEVAQFVMKHYLHTWPNHIKQIYAVVHKGPEGNEKVGTIIYGSPLPSATKVVGKEASPDEVLELKRLFINDELDQPNVESFVIAKSLKMLKQAEPNTKVVITFADDKQGHLGSIYQATNAIYIGKSTDGKHKYAYILRGNLKALRNKLPNRPYPKK